MYIEWVKDHWRDIQAKAPSQIPHMDDDDWYPDDVGESWDTKRQVPNFTPASKINWHDLIETETSVSKKGGGVRVELRAAFRNHRDSW